MDCNALPAIDFFLGDLGDQTGTHSVGYLSPTEYNP